jgi:drug/metabolite transporter (DMT)-like permease
LGKWYLFSIIALVLMGTQRFLYKVAAERNCPAAWTTFSFMATVTILSFIFLLALGESVLSWKMLGLIALWNSGAFVLGTVTHIEALKHLPSSIVYPVIRLNMVLVILFSILYFSDSLSPYQWIGMVTAAVVMVVLAREAEHKKEAYGDRKTGLILVFVSLLFGSMASISSKFAALYTNKLGFMALSYLLGTLFSLALTKEFNSQKRAKNLKQAIVIGSMMGVVNFAGFYAFLKALSQGPLSLVVSITGMHFVIAVVLSVVLYKEKLTVTRILGVALTVVSVLFLRS